jgi:hypothetical protein
VDEALAVGDLIFQHRCMHRMNHLRDGGKTIVLVTHDLDAVTKFCDQALLLDGGRILENGKPDLVVQKYRALIFERERGRIDFSRSNESPDRSGLFTPADKMPIARSIRNIDHRFGSKEAAILGVELLDEQGNPVAEALTGQIITIRISAQFHCEIDQPILGYTLRNRLGIEISASNTTFAGYPLPRARKDQICTSDFSVRLPALAVGSYTLSPAVAKGSLLQHDMCDWIDNALVFTIRSQDLIYGMLRMDTDVRNYMSCAE